MNPILRDFPDHFETERLLIRAPRFGDGAMLYQAVRESLEQLKPWMPWAHNELTAEGEETIVRRMCLNFMAREDLPLFLLKKDSGEFVGGSGLHRFDWAVPRFEIGYWARTSCQGKGYISEAVTGITRFAFERLFAERVEIHMDDLNTKSWRVAERCHFKLEGVLRNHARDVNNGLRNTRVYAKMRAEWYAQAEQEN